MSKTVAKIEWINTSDKEGGINMGKVCLFVLYACPSFNKITQNGRVDFNENKTNDRIWLNEEPIKFLV